MQVTSSSMLGHVLNPDLSMSSSTYFPPTISFYSEGIFGTYIKQVYYFHIMLKISQAILQKAQPYLRVLSFHVPVKTRVSLPMPEVHDVANADKSYSSSLKLSVISI